ASRKKSYSTGVKRKPVCYRSSFLNQPANPLGIRFLQGPVRQRPGGGGVDRANPLLHFRNGAGAHGKLAQSQSHKQLRHPGIARQFAAHADRRSEEHTSELQSRENLVCRLLLEKKTTPGPPS